MKERATTIFPYAVAAALPLAGLVLAAAWALDKRTYDAALVARVVSAGRARLVHPAERVSAGPVPRSEPGPHRATCP